VAQINPPSWAKNAVPTKHGWMDPRTKRIVKIVNIAEQDIKDYLGIVEKPDRRKKVPAQPLEEPKELTLEGSEDD
jgi:hypothetical protein